MCKCLTDQGDQLFTRRIHGLGKELLTVSTLKLLSGWLRAVLGN